MIEEEVDGVNAYGFRSETWNGMEEEEEEGGAGSDRSGSKVDTEV